MGRGYHYGPGAVGVGWSTCRLDLRVLPPSRCSGHRLRSFAERQQCRRLSTRRRWRGSCSATSIRVPEKFLLWFPSRPLGSASLPPGRTFWDELVIHYTRGVETVHKMRTTWDGLAPFVDVERTSRGRRVPRDSGEGSPMVAGRVYRLFPDVLQAAAACGICTA